MKAWTEVELEKDAMYMLLDAVLWLKIIFEYRVWIRLLQFIPAIN